MRLSRFIILLISLCSLLAFIAPAAGEASFYSTGLATSGVVNEYNPVTAGQWVAYQTSTPLLPDSHGSIVLRDLAEGSTVTIGGGDDADQTVPDVSGGRVVYEDDTGGDTDIRVYDAPTDFDWAIAETAADEVDPRICGNLVVWKNDSTKELWYRDLLRGVTGQVAGADNVTVFDVDNERIVWAEAFVEESLYYSEPGLHPARLFYSVPSDTDFVSLSLHGDWVGGVTDRAAGTNAVRHRVTATGAYTYPNGTADTDVFHDTVTYMVPQYEDDNICFIEPLAENVTFGSASYDNRDPAVFGRRVVYEQATGIANTDIYVGNADIEIDRTQGTDRYLTAIAASKAYFIRSDYAIVCTGQNFPDALSAGPLADAYGAPLLLTRRDAASPELLAELARLHVQNVVIVGGSDVVSDNVLQQIDAVVNGVWRLAGDDRYETSANIATLMWQEMYGAPFTVRRAFFARGDNFPDALAVGPVAAGARVPILLVKPTSVPASVAEAVDDMNLTSGVVVGGSDVVSDAVRSTLRTLMIANGGDDHDPMIVERWAGDTRYETAVAVIEQGVAARWIDLDTVGIATGINFPDALGGGAALGHYGSPVVLVKGGTVPAEVGTWINENAHAIGRMDMFGGTDVLPESLLGDMRDALH